jgi:hypothetical protein
MLTLPKFSMGVGDRFAHQGKAQFTIHKDTEKSC